MTHTTHRLYLRWTLCLCILLGTATASLAGAGYSNVLELRVYPVIEGRQGRFLEYFEEHFLESQEVVGMRIWGQFRDLETPTHFIWLRGYQSMEQRLTGLQQFYTSPVWTETGSEAVSMLSARVEHVHLLEPLSEQDAFAARHRRPSLVSEALEGESSGIVVADVFLLDEASDATVDAVRSQVVPGLEAAGGVVLGLFRTSDESNNFPILSVIEDERVLVLFSSFQDVAQYRAARDSADSPGRLETFVMEPGRRSRLRHQSPESP